MIVECKNCTTRFALDDSRIPLAGIRVRCSKCKEAFFLENPAATQEQAVDSIAFDAASDEAAQPPAPDTTQDLVSPPPAAGTGLEDEEEWEFNHDVPDESAIASSSAASSSADSSSAGESGIELASESAGASAAEPAAPVEEVAPISEPDVADPVSDYSPNDEVSFDDSEVDISGIDVAGIDESEVGAAGSDDETSSDDSDFDHSTIEDLAGSVHPDGSSHAGADSAAASGAAGAADSPAHGTTQAVAQGSKEPTTTDLGEPEDWDLLGEDSPSPSPEVSQYEDPGAAAPATTHMPSPHAAAAAAGVSMPSSLPVSVPALRLQSLLQNVGSAVGWTVTLALLGAALAQGVQRSLTTNPAGATTQFEVGPLVARSIETSWVPTTDGKTLLAVSGELHNPTSAPVRPDLDVTVLLLDSNGAPLDLPGLVAGRTLDADSLRDLPALRREQLGIEAATVLTSGPVPAGRSVTFGAYFSDVPVEARRVSVRGVPPATAFGADENSPWASAAGNDSAVDPGLASGSGAGAEPAGSPGSATEAALGADAAGVDTDAG